MKGNRKFLLALFALPALIVACVPWNTTVVPAVRVQVFDEHLFVVRVFVEQMFDEQMFGEQMFDEVAGISFSPAARRRSLRRECSAKCTTNYN